MISYDFTWFHMISYDFNIRSIFPLVTSQVFKRESSLRLPDSCPKSQASQASAASCPASPGSPQRVVRDEHDIYIYMGMDQYLLIPFLVGWTSIYQLFWCELQGYKVLTHCHIYINIKLVIIDIWSCISIDSIVLYTMLKIYHTSLGGLGAVSGEAFLISWRSYKNAMGTPGHSLTPKTPTRTPLEPDWNSTTFIRSCSHYLETILLGLKISTF